MRTLALALISVPAIACLPSCDLAFAEPKTTQWLCKRALMGITIVENGSDIDASLTLFNDAVFMPKPELVEEGESIGGMPLCMGVVDRETNTLVFPLKNVTMVQSNSARLMRENGSPYVEFDLDFTGPELVGRWRDGNKKPKFTRTFLRCGKPPVAE